MSEQQIPETVEDVWHACIDLTRLADRLGGTWELSSPPTRGETVYVVKVWIPLATPQVQPQAQQRLDLTGTGGGNHAKT